MNQSQIRKSELATQQADARQTQALLAPMMLLDDEALKHVAGGGPAGSWSQGIVQGPAGSW